MYDLYKYWSTKKDAVNEYKNEMFMRKVADEILFHLDGGESMLDFSCSAGEKVIYNAKKY